MLQPVLQLVVEADHQTATQAPGIAGLTSAEDPDKGIAVAAAAAPAPHRVVLVMAASRRSASTRGVRVVSGDLRKPSKKSSRKPNQGKIRSGTSMSEHARAVLTQVTCLAESISGEEQSTLMVVPMTLQRQAVAVLMPSGQRSELC